MHEEVSFVQATVMRPPVIPLLSLTQHTWPAETSQLTSPQRTLLPLGGAPPVPEPPESGGGTVPLSGPASGTVPPLPASGVPAPIPPEEAPPLCGCAPPSPRPPAAGV